MILKRPVHHGFELNVFFIFAVTVSAMVVAAVQKRSPFPVGQALIACWFCGETKLDKSNGVTVERPEQGAQHHRERKQAKATS